MNSRYIDHFSDKFFRGGELDPYNSDQSITFCFAYLGWLIDRFDGEIKKAVMAYNIGHGSVERGVRLEAGEKYWEKVQERVHFFR